MRIPPAAEEGRDAHLVRRCASGFAVVAVAAALVAFDWNPGSTNPSAPVARALDIAIVLVLVALPWVARGRGLFGPSAGARRVRLVRTGTYLVLCLLVVTIARVTRYAGARFEHFQAFDQDNWNADVVVGNLLGGLVLFGLLTAYAAGILASTSRRSSWPPAVVTVGATAGALGGIAIYALTPLGNVLRVTDPVPAVAYYVALPLCAFGPPLVAGLVATRRSTAGDDGRALQGLATGLWAGATAAMVVTVLTLSTMLAFPRQVQLIWANPDPSVPHGTPYEVLMTVGDTAGRYVTVLVAGPLLGGLLGVLGAGLRRRPRSDGGRVPSDITLA